MPEITRRNLAKNASWSIPAVVVAAAAPSIAGSPSPNSFCTLSTVPSGSSLYIRGADTQGNPVADDPSSTSMSSIKSIVSETTLPGVNVSSNDSSSNGALGNFANKITNDSSRTQATMPIQLSTGNALDAGATLTVDLSGWVMLNHSDSGYAAIDDSLLPIVSGVVVNMPEDVSGGSDNPINSQTGAMPTPSISVSGQKVTFTFPAIPANTRIALNVNMNFSALVSSDKWDYGLDADGKAVYTIATQPSTNFSYHVTGSSSSNNATLPSIGSVDSIFENTASAQLSGGNEFSLTQCS